MNTGFQSFVAGVLAITVDQEALVKVYLLVTVQLVGQVLAVQEAMKCIPGITLVELVTSPFDLHVTVEVNTVPELEHVLSCCETVEGIAQIIQMVVVA